MEQIERIQEMESCLDASEKAISELSEALSAFEEVQPMFRRLSDYYGSETWMQDFEDDEAGKLPRDLMTEHRELLVRMLRLVTDALESDGVS